MACRPDEKVCFNCCDWFDISKEKVKLCKKCNQYKCPHCNACLCEMSTSVIRAVYAMERTYEKWVREQGL